MINQEEEEEEGDGQGGLEGERSATLLLGHVGIRQSLKKPTLLATSFSALSHILHHINASMGEKHASPHPNQLSLLFLLSSLPLSLLPSFLPALPSSLPPYLGRPGEASRPSPPPDKDRCT